MRVQRLLALTALALAGLGSAPASAGPLECTIKPENCYVCVMYPCYPRDYPPFLMERVRDAIGDHASVEVNPPVVCVQEPCEQEPLVVVCLHDVAFCTE